MKHFKTYLINGNYKCYLCLIALLSVFESWSQAQEIYSDKELLTKGNTYYMDNNYRLAQAYLFAYVQRNTAAYQSDSQFKSQIDEALQYSINSGIGAGTDAKFDRIYQKDAQGHNIIPAPPVKPTLNLLSELTVSNINLNSGVYNCDDGGTYYVSVINNKVWWFGRHNANIWTNVMNGSLLGNEIRGTWADVPLGNTKNYGIMTLKIDDSNSFHIVSEQGGFGGKSWKRLLKKSHPTSAEATLTPGP